MGLDGRGGVRDGGEVVVEEVVWFAGLGEFVHWEGFDGGAQLMDALRHVQYQ